MPSFHKIRGEIQGDAHARVRARHLAEMRERNGGRNVILYYSGWLQDPGLGGMAGLSDWDKNGFMSVVHGLDRSKGLDLILHTPGGEIAATESLVDYLRAMFGADIRAVVPQLALSAGTMIVCAAKSVLMGKHSSLGPIDPQIPGGLAAHGVVEEFKRAHEEIMADPSKAAVWQPIIAQYPPTLVGECEKAIVWADEIARKWLESGMLAHLDKARRKKKADDIVGKLGDHALTLSHDRHLSAEYCGKIVGLTVEMLEDHQEMQDAVLSVHHACMLAMQEKDIAKMIENHEGVSVQISAPPLN